MSDNAKMLADLLRESQQSIGGDWRERRDKALAEFDATPSEPMEAARGEAKPVAKFPLRFSNNWLRQQIASDPDVDMDAGILHTEAPKLRFFIDHGLIHDRVTGRHVTTDEDSWTTPEGELMPNLHGSGITKTCDLLNELANRAAPLATRSNQTEHVAWLRYKIRDDGTTTIHLCDSDDKGAFKVYSAAALESFAASSAGEVDWERGRYPGKITQHWLRTAFERIAAGEPEREVMDDYGYAASSGEERDGERYRWLREQFRSPGLKMNGQHRWIPHGTPMATLQGPSFDAAIDAAIAHQKAGTGGEEGGGK